ncbi:MAG TPA: YciI family protein [Longimicrobium sp.]|jgi:uncharacterized protein YciI
MKTVYALIWTLTSTPEEFDARVPALLEWLRALKREGRLLGCGAWSSGDGGLTLVEAETLEEAEQINAANPLSPLGRTEIRAWEVYDASLMVDSGM